MQAILSPRARQDLLGLMRALAEAVDDPQDQTPDQFRAAVLESLDLLRRFPLAGPACDLPGDEFPNLRKLNIGGRFRNYLIFYEVGPEVLTVLRILHGARDLRRVIIEGE